MGQELPSPLVHLLYGLISVFAFSPLFLLSSCSLANFKYHFAKQEINVPPVLRKSSLPVYSYINTFLVQLTRVVAFFTSPIAFVVRGKL